MYAANTACSEPGGLRSSEQLDRRLTQMIGSDGLTCANDGTNQTRQK